MNLRDETLNYIHYNKKQYTTSTTARNEDPSNGFTKSGPLMIDKEWTTSDSTVPARDWLSTPWSLIPTYSKWHVDFQIYCTSKYTTYLYMYVALYIEVTYLTSPDSQISPTWDLCFILMRWWWTAPNDNKELRSRNEAKLFKLIVALDPMDLHSLRIKFLNI